MTKEIKRVHALTSTASGVAGEARIAAELTRCGIKVAKPYWNDDEIDLIVFVDASRNWIPLPIQVKSLQFRPESNKPAPKYVSTQGLKRKYLDRQPALCLALYHPTSDDIWFIDGAENIKQVYEDQSNGSKRRRAYSALDAEDDVPIRLFHQPDPIFNNKWLVDKADAKWLSDRTNRIAREFANQQKRVAVLQHIFTTPADVEYSESAEEADEAE